MRRLVGFAVLAGALACPALAFGLVAASDDGALSVKNGVGRIALAPFNGSALGRVAHGKITIVDPVSGDDGSFDVRGCDGANDVSTERVTVCSGTNLGLRVIDGRYKLIIRGAGINLSVVGRGSVTLDGSGESPDVDFDGVYSLNDSSYRSLPNVEKPLALVAPGG